MKIKLPSPKYLVKNTRVFVSRNKHSIYTVAGCLIGCVALYSTHKATEKSTKEIIQYEQEHECELTTKEKIKLVAPNYIFSMAATIASGVCFFKGDKAANEKIAKFDAAYHIQQAAVTGIQNEIKERYGKETADDISKAVIDKKTPIKTDTPPNIMHSGEKYKCRCNTTGTIFYASYGEIVHALNKMNKILLNEGEDASLNDFFDEVDGSHCDLGDEYGFEAGTELLIGENVFVHGTDDGRGSLMWQVEFKYDASPVYILPFNR